MDAMSKRIHAQANTTAYAGINAYMRKTVHVCPEANTKLEVRSLYASTHLLV